MSRLRSGAGNPACGLAFSQSSRLKGGLGVIRLCFEQEKKMSIAGYIAPTHVPGTGAEEYRDVEDYDPCSSRTAGYQAK